MARNAKKKKEMNAKINLVQDERNGPEFEPLFKFIKDFKVKVTVFDQKDNIIREEIMNYGLPSDRIWLGKLSFYYWNKGFYVETERLTE